MLTSGLIFESLLVYCHIDSLFDENSVTQCDAVVANINSTIASDNLLNFRLLAMTN